MHPAPPASPHAANVRLVSLLLIGLNVAIYVAQGLGGAPWIDRPASAQIDWGGNLAMLSLTGDTWRLAASMFLHGGLLHLAMNMSMLYLMGPDAERQFGRLGMLMLYLGGGLAGSCASAWWTGSHLARQIEHGGDGHWMIVSVGASGALMALCGGLLAAVTMDAVRGQRSPLGRGFGMSLAQVVLINLVAGAAMQGVDQAAHVGGLVAGGLIGALMSLGQGRHAVARVWRLAEPVLVGAACVWLVTTRMDWAPLEALREQQELFERQAPGEDSSLDKRPMSVALATRAEHSSTPPVDKFVPKPCPGSPSACQANGFVALPPD